MQTELQNIEKLTQSDSYPGVFTRVKALIIDSGFILLVFMLAFNVFDFMGNIPGYVRGGVLVFMIFLYEPLMVSLFGFTIGHFFMKIRVKDNSNPSKNISILSSFFRTFIKSLFGIISFFIIGFNTKRRALHDMASGSVVIEVQ